MLVLGVKLMTSRRVRYGALAVCPLWLFGAHSGALADPPSGTQAGAPASSATEEPKTLAQDGLSSLLKQAVRQGYDHEVVRGHFDLGSPPNVHRYYCLVDIKTGYREPNGVLGDTVPLAGGMTGIKNSSVSLYRCANAEQHGMLITTGYVLGGAAAGPVAPPAAATAPVVQAAPAAPAVQAAPAIPAQTPAEVPAPTALPANAAASLNQFDIADEKIPAAIYTDPTPNKQYPATMIVLHIPSHGVDINGVAYLPVGQGPHPVLILCHGLPGNEKNLDLAQAVRRAGWVTVTFNYRGSWGSPGTFSFKGSVADTEAVLGYLREPKTAATLRLDPHRIVLAGHSMGGGITVQVAAKDPALMGAVLISAWDMSSGAAMKHEQLVADMADDMETLAGVTAESMAAELTAHADELSFAGAAAGLTGTELLVLTSDDGNTERTNDLVRAIRAKGGHRVTEKHVATDHGWSDRRIELEADVINWLKQLH